MTVDWEKFFTERPDDMVYPSELSPDPSQEIVRIEDVHAELQLLWETGIRPGLDTGWYSLADYFTVRKRELTVITGHPTHGKSAWMDNLLVQMARLHDWRWGIFSAENLPIERHIARLMEIYLGKPFSKGPTPRMELSEMAVAETFLAEHAQFIRPSEHRHSLARIIEIAKYMIDSFAIDAVILDPWNELDHGRPDKMREDEYISVALSTVRWFTRNHDIHFFIVAHPKSIQRDNDGTRPPPTLDDVKGASEWNAKADNGITIWRERKNPKHETWVIIDKIRFREVGQIGRVILVYDTVTGRFVDPVAPRLWKREPGEEG